MATRILPISDLCHQATGFMKTLREEGSVVFVTQHGCPTAVLVDYEAYEALLARLEGTDDHVGLMSPESEPERNRGNFLIVAQSANLDGPPDWSENLDEYLYGGKQIDGD